MYTDEEFADRLRGRMRAATAGVEAGPALAGAVRRRHARQTLALRAAIALPLAAVVATAGALATTGGDHAPPAAGAGSGAPQGGALRDVAFVTAQTGAALARADDYVRVVTWKAGAGETWRSSVDGGTHRERKDVSGAAGPMRSMLARGTLATGAYLLVVDYQHRAWWDTATPPTGRSADAGVVRQLMWPNPYEDPRHILVLLDAKRLRLVGPEAVGGHETLHLSATDGSTDLWVDGATYLPVRQTGALTVDYEWLPRTPENLARFELAAPDGFTHRDTPIA
ncbi:hypothetical protein [Dactylosporangium salmoneum]|uniref:Uncharacterized protein n=1 Tax=Dactylosporangium salmoneum TaxID=53361 RepID=A0ABP5UYQ9_9ACTN